jgi:hypothetical protein
MHDDYDGAMPRDPLPDTADQEPELRVLLAFAREERWPGPVEDLSELVSHARRELERLDEMIARPPLDAADVELALKGAARYVSIAITRLKPLRGWTR